MKNVISKTKTTHTTSQDTHTNILTKPQHRQKLSNCGGGIGLKMNDVLKELHLPMPKYLKLSTLANNEGGRGLNGF